MKYIKLFESFNVYEEFGTNYVWKGWLKKTLMEICCMYKDEVLGSIVHSSDTWEDGTILKELVKETDDSKIKSILDNMAKLSNFDYKGHSESIFDYLQDEDCDYIAKFLGLAPLNYEEDWTDEEEDTWDKQKCAIYDYVMDQYNDIIDMEEKEIAPLTPKGGT